MTVDRDLQRYWQRRSFDPEEKPPEVISKDGEEERKWKPIKPPKRPWWKFGLSECQIKGCEEEVLLEKTWDVEHKIGGRDDDDDDAPKPKPGVIYFEVLNTLYHIDKLKLTVLRCKRCDAEWYMEDTWGEGEPLTISQWHSMEVPGRVVVHEDNLVKNKEEKEKEEE